MANDELLVVPVGSVCGHPVYLVEVGDGWLHQDLNASREITSARGAVNTIFESAAISPLPY